MYKTRIVDTVRKTLPLHPVLEMGHRRSILRTNHYVLLISVSLRGGATSPPLVMLQRWNSAR